MAFLIRAEFLLGTYQGHDRHGLIEQYPSPLRLHSAFVAGAYSRCRQNTEQPPTEVVELDSMSSSALSWLETNVPDAVTLPRSVINDGQDARAYRDKGTAGGKKASELAVGHAAVDGPVIWWWADEPDPSVQTVLADVSQEIPYLGESFSPVSLTTGLAPDIDGQAFVQNHSGTFRATDAITLAAPLRGRTAALQEDYFAGATAPFPTKSRDSAVGSNGRPRANEAEMPDPWNATSVARSVSYVRSRPAPADDSPWTDGILIRVTPRSSRVLWPPVPEDHVAWTVAFHRGIASRLGPDAPPLVTGKYPDRSKQPPNRLSIQILDGGMDLALDLRPPEAAFLIAIPRDASGEDVDQLMDAVHMVDNVLLPGGRALDVTSVELVDTTRLWKPPSPRHDRWWFPHPLVIADSRSPRRKALGDGSWAIDDVLRVAVGNVYRNHPRLTVPGRGDDRLIRLSSAVDELGVRIGAAHRSYPLRPNRYVHHMNPGAAVIAVQGLIHLGAIRSDRSFVALGQSRHLGGGLLVPFDLPAAVTNRLSDSEEDHDHER